MTKKDKYEFVELRLVDIYGKMRGMTVPLDEPKTIAQIIDDPIMSKGINVDGSSLPEFADIENSDLHLSPDKTTIRVVPGSNPPKVSVLCSLYSRSDDNDAETLYLGDARNLLQEILNTSYKGIQVNIKPEPEFYIIESDEYGRIEPSDTGGYIDVAPTDHSNNMMMYFTEVLKELDINVHYLHHEVGPGQQEIEIEFDDVLKNCDNLTHFKPTIKALSREFGLDATFMPKPFFNQAGNGLHIHIQLWKDGKNLFGDSTQPGKISDMAKYFIAGILNHAPAISAVANPSINSYKRLGGFEAPVYICWGYRNRSTLVRVPLFREPEKAAIEIRSPDFTSNPYLLLSVLLEAGMDGINQKMMPGNPQKENVYKLKPEQIVSRGIDTLPENLGLAIQALEQDHFILNALGSYLGPTWVEMKKKEWHRYNNEIITDFELEQYIDC